MIKHLLFLCLFLIQPLGFAAVKSDAIVGVWLTQIQDAKIEIYQKSSKYYGRVVWMLEPNNENGKPQLDENNPDSALRKKPIFNMDILIGFVYDNDGAWNGVIYDPKDGAQYTCKLWISGSTLKVRGYSGWLYQTKTWTKAS